MNTVICMSPRRGSCERLTSLIHSRAGFDPVFLREMTFSACDGCGACDHTGVCRHEDEAKRLWERIRGGGKTVFVTPLYFCNFPSQAKAFIDRAQAYWQRREKCPSRFYLIAVGGRGEENNFASAYLTFRAVCLTAGAEEAGSLYLPEVETKEDISREYEEKVLKFIE